MLLLLANNLSAFPPLFIGEMKLFTTCNDIRPQLETLKSQKKVGNH